MAVTLRSLFGDKLTPELVESLPAETKKVLDFFVYTYDPSNKGLEPMPKYRIEELTAPLEATIKNKDEEIESLKKNSEQHLTDLKTYKKAAEGNEELVKKFDEAIKTAKEQKDTYEAQIKERDEKFTKEQTLNKKSYALRIGLHDEGVNDETSREVLAKTFDLEKLELDDNGKIKDLKILVQPYRENKSFESMFGEIKIAGQGHQDGEGDGDNKFFTREQVQAKADDQAWVNENLEAINESMKKWK